MKIIEIESITYPYHPEKLLPYGLVIFLTGNKKLKSIKFNDTTFGVSSEGYYEDFFLTNEERVEKEVEIRATIKKIRATI